MSPGRTARRALARFFSFIQKLFLIDPRDRVIRETLARYEDGLEGDPNEPGRQRDEFDN
jgi:hypothetical protein